MTFAWHRLNRSMLQRLLLAGLLVGLSSHTVWADQPHLPSSVWQSVPDQVPAPRKPWVLRDRAIGLNPQSLQTLKDAAARPHPPVFIELFDDIRYELDITSTISRINDSAVIRGLLKNTPHGDFTFSINGSVMAGAIHVGDRLFTVEHVSNGHHRLLELNPATLPPD
ncbi:MAG: hypothetical protein ACREIJ_12085 [Nitrospiraceae bacterium]